MTAPTDKYKTIKRGDSPEAVRAALGEPDNIIISDEKGEIIWEYNVPEWPAVTFRYFFKGKAVITTQKSIRRQTPVEMPQLVISGEAALLKANELFDQERIMAGTPAGDAAPEEVLKGFMTAMNRWETSCREQDLLVKKGELQREQSDALKRDAQLAIFNRYVTPKSRKERLVTTWPPTYIPAEDVISEVKQETRTRVTIITARKDGHKKRLTLLKKEGSWLVDTQEIDDTGAGWLKWWL